MDRVLLIDGLNFIHRANIKFASKDDKLSYTIVYNTFRNLRATIEMFEPSKVFFCLEGKDIFRYKLFPDYKANRIIKTSSIKESENENFHRQKDIVINLLAHLPIITVKANGFECDDVIATLAADLLDEEAIIVSTDSDYIQLLQKAYKNLKIFNPKSKSYMESPDYNFLVFKSCGDRSDNIPTILSKTKAIRIASDIDAFKEFLSTEENRANFSLNRELVELKIIPNEKLSFNDYEKNFQSLKEEFNKMEFNSIIEDNYWNRFVKTFDGLR